MNFAEERCTTNRRIFTRRQFSAALFMCIVCGTANLHAETNTSSPELISFQRGDLTLRGFIYKPAGKGPFPAVLYNHGSNQKLGNCAPLAQFWTTNGFVFFFPHRSGHGLSPGEWIVDAQQKFRAAEKDRDVSRKHDIELHERANLDVEAALAWLKQQSFVDTNKIVMSGISYGGIQTVLASEKELGVKAYVPFAPAAMSWQGNPLLRERLLQAVKKAKAPMFLLQAQNDYNLGPSELLGGELKRKGAPNRAKLYPPYGDPNNHADGHGGFAVRGSNVWGADVLSFVNELLRQGE
jgi:dipeptidyl aminopeptidase/acylaminoacyl peptidase